MTSDTGNNSRLRELDLFANLALFEGCSQHEITAFVQALYKSSLQTLRLCMCPLADKATAVTVLHHLPPSLECLHVVNCHLTSTHLLSQLAGQLQHLPKLSSLSMDGWNHVQAPRVEATWRPALAANTALTKIQMSRFAARPAWRAHLDHIVQRNQLIVRVQATLQMNDPHLARMASTLLMARVGRAEEGLSALFLFLRSSPGLFCVQPSAT